MLQSSMNYKYLLLINRYKVMERYHRYGPKIVRISLVLLAISVGFTTFIIVEIFALNDDQNALNILYGRSLGTISCYQLCSSTPNQQSGSCCDTSLTNCQPKSACYQSKISAYQSVINQETDYIDYFSIPAVVFLVSSIVAFIYFLRLRKKFKEQEWMIAYQDSFLPNQDNNANYYEDDSEEQFENYGAFLQYMVEHGYLYQIPANQKKGDSRITQSFATNDETVCPICMMEYKEEKVLKLRCNHKFHSGCIRDWNQANSSCPVCRGDIYQ